MTRIASEVDHEVISSDTSGQYLSEQLRQVFDGMVAAAGMNRHLSVKVLVEIEAAKQ